MRTLTVPLDERSYPIYIGRGLIERGDLYTAHLPGRQLLIVTNDVVGPLYLEPVTRACGGLEVDSLVLPDGEQHKTLETFERVIDRLMERRFDRQATVAALGGGVIGDIAGFAAACYQRGVPFVQLPTTLLAQVDSSVGGKTGVNHPLGKNMIGAFHQPRAVIADTATLDTLDRRQLAAGMAEVIKYGLIRDAEFFGWLESNIDALCQREPEALAFAIERSCQNKADVVAADEREQGQLALLNLGHTFGHAIETATGYAEWLHGEAVGAGMCMAARFSAQLGWLADAEVERIEGVIAAAGLPTQPPREVAGERLLELMAGDKKVRGGRIRLVLLKRIGDAIVTDEYPNDELHRMLNASPTEATS